MDATFFDHRENPLHVAPSAMTASILQKPKQKKSDKLEMLYQYLTKIKNENFTGYIKVNFSQGNVGRVEKFEEILKR